MAADQPPRMPLAENGAVVHDHDVIAEPLRLFHEMRGEQQGCAGVFKLPQTGPDKMPHLGIQPRCRLVQHQQFRFIHQGPGDAEAPFHASRQLANAGVRFFIQLHEFQQLPGSFLHRGAAKIEKAGVHLQVFGDGEIGV